MIPTKPRAITIERVLDIMKEFGINLATSAEQGEKASVASANLNGYPVMFAVLDSVLIVRADKDTTTEVSSGDPRWHLACNQANCFNFSAKAVAVDRGEKVILRAEKDIPIVAGLSDTQLSTMLKIALDNVLGVHKAIEDAATELS